MWELIKIFVGRVIASGHLEDYMISWPLAGVHFI